MLKDWQWTGGGSALDHRCSDSDKGIAGPATAKSGTQTNQTYKVPFPMNNSSSYSDLYDWSITDPTSFWQGQAEAIHWQTPFHTVCDFTNPPFVRWFVGGRTNLCYNAVDRHLAKRADQAAIFFHSSEFSTEKVVTYGQLHGEVTRFAAVLKKLGINKGDRVVIYLPMIPEAAYAVLACARLGAIHSVVFGGFSPDSLAGRIEDCKSKIVITADEGLRGGRKVPLKANVDAAIAKLGDGIDHVIVVRRTGGDVDWVAGRDIWYHEECAKVSADCPPEPMNAEDPLFILYTS